MERRLILAVLGTINVVAHEGFGKRLPVRHPPHIAGVDPISNRPDNSDRCHETSSAIAPGSTVRA
jgi:hypothetical protein